MDIRMDIISPYRIINNRHNTEELKGARQLKVNYTGPPK